jgi:hypothetical protein
VKATNFATKDTLPTGDANKIVKGTELDNEFNAIAGAISSKADLASPALTGTPTAPTATTGSNTTQLANTSFVTAAVAAALQAIYPVGSIYTNATSSTNPSSLLGFGTWSAFAAGRVLVGLDSSNAAFDTAEETGGSATATTSSSGAGSTSTESVTVSRDGWGTSGGNLNSSTSVQAGRLVVGSGGVETYETLESLRSSGNDLTTGSHSHTVSNHTHTVSTISPYITVYMWKRTA